MKEATIRQKRLLAVPVFCFSLFKKELLVFAPEMGWKRIVGQL